jgi:hypothetical protein
MTCRRWFGRRTSDRRLLHNLAIAIFLICSTERRCAMAPALIVEDGRDSLDHADAGDEFVPEPVGVVRHHLQVGNGTLWPAPWLCGCAPISRCRGTERLGRLAGDRGGCGWGPC